MPEDPRPLVLVVDDDPALRSSLERSLSRGGFAVRTAEDGDRALEFLAAEVPDLILLDVVMPGTLDGFELCRQIHAQERLSLVPIIFVTGLHGEEDKAAAFAAGGAGYIRKPFEFQELLDEMLRHLDRGRRWAGLREPEIDWTAWLKPGTFRAFKEALTTDRRPDPARKEAALACGPDELYELARHLSMPDEQLARHVARFLDLPFTPRLHADDVLLGELPRAFCERNLVVPVRLPHDGVGVVLSNPFQWELLDTLNRSIWREHTPEVSVADPAVIRHVFEDPSDRVLRVAAPDVTSLDSHGRGADGDHSVLELANELLSAAVHERASDVHVEPKARDTLVRFRIDGEMQDIRSLEHDQARRLISRFKALAGMDIAERRKPQDGSVEVLVDQRRLKLRLATSSTSDGETLVIRVLEPTKAAVPLDELGMTPDQVTQVRTMAARHQGMVLVVGPTGSGKSTTIFSLLSGVDGRSRSIMSVEDPVEYRIPFANQQQVNERAGVTFEALLRSAMRQDPDILFLGEIRDPYSAKASLDFASSGHLTVSTLHSSNASTAVFRLERLGIERSSMADSLLGIIAQKLLRKLCPLCKTEGPITDEERGYLAGFTDDVPDIVARPVGCPACRETGYQGREGVYEILRFDPTLSELVRSGASIARIRAFSTDRGDFMVYDHAIEKVRARVCSPRDAYEMVLLEEMRFREASDARRSMGLEGGGHPPERSSNGAGAGAAENGAVRRSGVDGGPAAEPAERSHGGEAGSGAAPAGGSPARAASDAASDAPSVLVVEDDAVARKMISAILDKNGCRTTSASDGVEALLALGAESFDMVVSDLNMPNLDGHKLLEMLTVKGVDIPVLFVTGDTDPDVEARVLEAGAADFIRKPIRPEILLSRVRNALRGRVRATA